MYSKYTSGRVTVAPPCYGPRRRGRDVYSSFFAKHRYGCSSGTGVDRPGRAGPHGSGRGGIVLPRSSASGRFRYPERARVATGRLVVDGTKVAVDVSHGGAGLEPSAVDD